MPDNDLCSTKIYTNTSNGSCNCCCCGSSVGPAGPMGPMGPQGPQGPRGVQGVQGPQGPAGPAGATGAPGAIGPIGPAGPVGPAGVAGAAATVAVGTVTTGAPGSAAAVTNTGTDTAAVLNFTVPAGPAGPAGATGATGAPGPVGPAGPAGATGATGATGPAGPAGPAGATATNDNALLYNDALQTVASGGTVALPTNLINSPDGSIAASGTDGVTLAAGTYLVNFVSDAGTTGAGDVDAALQLDGTPLSYTETSLTQTGPAETRIALNSIVTSTGGQVLSVVNNGTAANTHDNSVLTVVRLA